MRHVQALLFALGRLMRQPVASFFTLLVIALALALPACLALLVSNASAATGHLSDAVEVSVYFKPDVSIEKVQQLARTAGARAGIARVRVVPADDALKEFRETSGFGEALEALEGNPLPHVLSVVPTLEAASPAAVEDLRRYLAAWPEVDAVQLDSDWVRRLDAIVALLRRVALGTGGLLALGVLAVIGNTIRLEIQNRREEIEVTKLVGGSNPFVRRPFLYSGLLFGGVGRAARVRDRRRGGGRPGRARGAPVHGLRRQLRPAGAGMARAGSDAGCRGGARLVRRLGNRHAPDPAHRATRLKPARRRLTP